MMLSVAGPEMLMLSCCVAVCAVGVVESVTFTVKLNEPEPVGAPEICPVEAVRLRPGGSTPELMLHVYGVVPPLAASVTLYAVPCVPLANELVVMLTGVTLVFMTMLSAFDAVCAGVVESVTFTVKLNVPEAVGVPEITPLVGMMLSPEGSEPALMLQL